MGLDFVDITFRLEETFKLDLSEEDFTDLVRDQDITAGDLYDFILKKKYLHDAARNNVRLNYFLWAEMQDVLHTVTNVPPEQIELGTDLSTLFPRKNRRETWGALRKECRYRVRELDYPPFVRGVGFSLAAGVVLIEQFQLWQIAGAKWLWPFLGLLGFWMVSETYLKLLSICARLRNSFPSGIITVKDLCRAVLAVNYHDVCNDIEVTVDERSLAVWHQLTEILAETLGVDAAAVTFRSRLIHDLGMA